MIKKFFICGFIFSFLVNCSDNDGLSEDADQDNFINIAGARIALNSQTPRDWNGQVIDPYINPDPNKALKGLLYLVVSSCSYQVFL